MSGHGHVETSPETPSILRQEKPSLPSPVHTSVLDWGRLLFGTSRRAKESLCAFAEAPRQLRTIMLHQKARLAKSLEAFSQRHFHSSPAYFLAGEPSSPQADG